MVESAVQHRWLDSESKYCHHLQGSPWESCGTELRVRPKSLSEPDRQRWFFDGVHVRHLVDGRVLDVNFGVQEVGQGVHVNVAHGDTVGQAWEFNGEVAAAPGADGFVRVRLTVSYAAK